MENYKNEKSMYGRYQRTDWHFDAGWMWKISGCGYGYGVCTEKRNRAFGGC